MEMNNKSIKYRKILTNQLSRGLISNKKYKKEIAWIKDWEKRNIN